MEEKVVRNPIPLSIITMSVIALWAFAAAPCRAGGGPQNVIIIVDPNDPAGVYLANYYRNARDIPERNVFYFYPGANTYAEFVAEKIDTLFGMLYGREIADHVDFIQVISNFVFRVSAPGLVTDGCFPVNNFSIASCYGMAFIAHEIQTATLSSTDTNRYYSSTDTATAFHSSTLWLNGSSGSGATARRYFCAGMLGYTGPNGNTVPELVQLIDRSVSADFSRPAGRFYFIETTDTARQGCCPGRNTTYPATVSRIIADGGNAIYIPAANNQVLPDNQNDILGVMTGWPNPDIQNAPMTILPGAFCDHLTSFAGYFDETGQTKMSRWIARGASGSVGTVEEPCNYIQKFPNPRLHVWYHRQLNLGEACFRSLNATPFQPLIYGDIMTQPFAYRPNVSWPAPNEPLTGTVMITPTGSTARPSTTVSRFQLYINGKFHSQVNASQSFSVDTTLLPDGANEFRVVGIDNSTIETQGRLVRVLNVDNHGRSATISVSPGSGGREVEFMVNVGGAGGSVREIRLMSNGRVIAATASGSDTFSLFGEMFGAGPQRLQAVAEFTDGLLAQSPFAPIDVAFNAAPSPQPQSGPPTAYSYTMDVTAMRPFVLDLPASDPDTTTLVYSVTQLPAQAAVSGSGRTRLIRPDVNASGSDTLQFIVNDGQYNSPTATVTLRYSTNDVTITQQPQSRVACNGQTVTFTVAATGCGPLNYQWQRNGVDLIGQVTPTLTLTSVTASNNGTYTCIVSGCRVRTSDPATLQVIGPPTISQQPQSRTVCVGQSVTFTVASNSPGTLTYQWLRNNLNINGATNPSYTIPSVQTSDAAQYRCRVSNQCGNVLSAIATLTVNLVRGDMTSDCIVTAADIPIFVNVLLGIETDPSLVQRADMNADGTADGADVQGFVNALP